MIIEKANKDIVEFDKIKATEVFEYDGEFFIKTKARPIPEYKARDYNAVSVEDGELWSMADDEKVVRHAEAKIILGGD